MLVYMLLNVITEKAYVGQTIHTLDKRLRGHWEQADGQSSAQIHDAMREWHDPCFWDMVVLQHCYDQSQLDQAEAAWQHICNTHDPAIGYNARKEKIDNGNSLTTTRVNSPIANMTQEQAREYYREQGRKGTKPKEEMTEERRAFYRECGKRGAAARKKKE